MVDEAGLGEKFIIESAATSTEEIGNPPHRGTVNKLREVSIPLIPHHAVQVTRQDYEKYDYIIGMDARNKANLKRLFDGDPKNKVFNLLEFAGKDRDIADPWYTGDFDKTYEDVVEGCSAFIKYVLKDETGY